MDLATEKKPDWDVDEEWDASVGFKSSFEFTISVDNSTSKQLQDKVLIKEENDLEDNGGRSKEASVENLSLSKRRKLRLKKSDGKKRKAS